MKCHQLQFSWMLTVNEEAVLDVYHDDKDLLPDMIDMIRIGSRMDHTISYTSCFCIKTIGPQTSTRIAKVLAPGQTHATGSIRLNGNWRVIIPSTHRSRVETNASNTIQSPCAPLGLLSLHTVPLPRPALNTAHRHLKRRQHQLQPHCTYNRRH